MANKYYWYIQNEIKVNFATDGRSSLTHRHSFRSAAVDGKCNKCISDEQMSDLISVRSENEIGGCVQQDVVLDWFVDVTGSNALQLDHVVTRNRQNVFMKKKIAANDVIGRQIS